ncbi:MAG TPA: class I SAM-dependent methyltransferase [Agriterribacter sp.]|nr:class I SAM-dependent methyltransferase [Agriterribacter sp.]
MKTSFIVKWYDIFINPFYFTRKGLYNSLHKFAPKLKGQLLDFGCGSKPYQPLFVSCDSYLGLDMENPGHPHINEKIDVFYDGKNIPFAADHFDSVFCSEVMEHVFNPDEIIAEICRVMKPGGQLLLTCPFVWAEHEVPYDYARYSSFGIKHLLEKNGFKVLLQKKEGHFTEVIIQQIIFYIFCLLPKRPALLYLFLHQIFILPFVITGLLLNLLPGSALKRKELYHSNIVLATKAG